MPPIHMSLQKKLASAFPSPAVAVASACAVLSFLLALLMWQRAGNPAVFLVWLAAATTVVAYSRVHRRWIASIERIAAQRPRISLRSIGRNWDGCAEEVAFIELPRGSEDKGLRIGSAGLSA